MAKHVALPDQRMERSAAVLQPLPATKFEHLDTTCRATVCITMALGPKPKSDSKMWHVSLLPAPAFPHQGYVRLLLWALLLW